MPFAVELFLDTPTEQIIYNVWRELADEGICSYLMREGNAFPHVTLSVFEEVKTEETLAVLKTLGQECSALEVTFSSICLFPTTGVLYVGLTVTQELLTMHQRCWQGLRNKAEGFWNYYLPGQWVPHCALAVEMGPKQISQAIQIGLHLPLPMQCRLQRVGLVEFDPQVKSLGTFDLQENDSSSR